MMKKTAILALIFISFLAYGFKYDLSRPVKTEDDIADMYYATEISEEEYVELWDLFANPVDINTADKTSLERLPDITPELAEEIIKARPFKDEKEIKEAIGKSVFDLIEVFIKFERPVEKKEVKPTAVKRKAKIAFKGDIGFKYVDEISSYHKAPETPYLSIDGKFSFGKKLVIGILEERKWTTPGYEIYEGPVVYDENYKIIAEPGDVVIKNQRTIFSDPKFYLNFNSKAFSFIIGNFGAGFGLGAVFNESGKRLLNGFTGDLSSNADYDYKRLYGAGAKLDLNVFRLFMFYSDIKDKCTVYSGILESTGDIDEIESQEDWDLLASESRSIPEYIDKNVYGGHAEIGSEENFIGATIYKTKEDFATENYRPYTYTEDMYDALVWGVNMELNPSSNIVLQWEYAHIDLGDSGFVLRSFLKEKTLKMELIYRDFQRNFENPYSYTYATWDTPSEFSAQNEKGIKFNTQLKLGKTEFGAKCDVWKYYSSLQMNFDGTVSLKYPVSPLVDLSFSQRFKDKDLSRDLDDSYTTDYSESDRSSYTYITLKYEPKENISFSTVYRYKMYMEHSEPQTKPSSSFQYRLSWKNPVADLILSYKFNDDNLYRKYDSSSGEEYRDLQINLQKYLFSRKLKITFGYRRRFYMEDESSRNPETLPERVYKVYIDWRI